MYVLWPLKSIFEGHCIPLFSPKIVANDTLSCPESPVSAKLRFPVAIHPLGIFVFWVACEYYF